MAGKSFPILVLTYNRPAMLDQTLQSLLEVRGVQRKQVVVVQDGGLAEVAAVARRHQVNLHQRRGTAPHGGAWG